METQAEYLINRFGSIAATARALGHRNPSTVQGWKERGSVPVQQFQRLIEAGATLHPPLEQREYFEGLDGTPHRLSRADAAA